MLLLEVGVPCKCRPASMALPAVVVIAIVNGSDLCILVSSRSCGKVDFPVVDFKVLPIFAQFLNVSRFEKHEYGD